LVYTNTAIFFQFNLFCAKIGSVINENKRQAIVVLHFVI
jgi:hypothetical protein